ncbi:MAG: dimethyl sulfoxide reductase [Clostridia bacterium]|nr:dimethyl sulfoxide reductase [Clostridia bacterium]
MFFENFDEWRRISPILGVDSSLSQEEYDRLLKGTHANTYIPLWASCAKSNSKILLDETTLRVIRNYKEFGYKAIPMDGNPPDYIGQQFRFLEYLTICNLKESNNFGAIAGQFINDFTLDTVRALKAAMLNESAHPEIAFICTAMSDMVSGKDVPVFALEEQLKNFDSRHWNKESPDDLEPAYYKKIASFNDCGAKCLMKALVQEGCILEIQPDTSVLPFTGCARGRAYRHTFLTADRLRYPMQRVGKRGEGKFKRITWEEAAEKVASEIKKCYRNYGPGSFYVTPASGVSALVRGDRFMKRLLGLNGGFLSYYNYYSAACANYTTPYIYGTTECGHSPEDVLHTEFLVLWGHNPAENHFGPFQNRILMQAKEKGIPIVVIDPRKSESVLAYADEWIPIKPSTDSALADAMCWWIWKNGLQDQPFMDYFCLGFDEEHMPDGVPPGESYHSYLFGRKDGVEKTPKWAEAITGIPSSVIENLAKRYATAKPACLMPGLGPQRTGNGEQFYRSMTALSCITGNVGKTGGSSGGTPWIPTHVLPDFSAFENPYKGAIPSFLWTKAVSSAKEMTSESDGLTGVDSLGAGIKVMFNLANGLLLSQHSDVNSTVRTLTDESKLDFLVVSDLFMTPGAMFADLLLPAPSFFEVENIVPPWVTDDYLLFNQKCIEALFGSRFEYDWISDVSKELGCHAAFTDNKRTAFEWIQELYCKTKEIEPELPEFSVFMENGGFAFEKGENIVAFKDIVENGGQFSTPSGKIEIFAKSLYDMNKPDDIPGLPKYVACQEGPEDPSVAVYPLQLIGYHTKRRCHSIHDNNPLLEELDKPLLWINTEDAKERNIQDGNLTETYNDRGCVRIPAKVTDKIMRGVVAISEGGWYRPDKNGVDERGCINVLTSSKPTPLAKGNPQHTNLVEVRVKQ